MEEKLDLRMYIKVLLRYWPWIVGLTFAAALIAYVYSSLMPTVYQASSVIAVVPPRYQLQFDPRVETTSRWSPDAKAFPALATSDGILQSVVESYTPSPEAAIADWRLPALAGMVRANSGGEPGLVTLQVRSRSAEDAAAIANLWADVFARKAKQIYGGSEQDVTFFEKQVAGRVTALEAADAALVEFGARDRSGMITAQVEALIQAQTDYSADQRAIAEMIQDIEGLRNQLAAQPGSEPSSVADGLTALLLQIKAFNAQSEAPLGLQIDTRESLSDRSLAEQVTFLDGLVTSLEDKSDEINRRLEEITPQVLALQKDLQAVTVEHDGLVRAQELARETYLTLARKLDEARITAEEQAGLLQVVSYASVPEQPIGPRKLFNTAVGAALGLMVGVMVVFFVDFWRRTGVQAPTAGAAQAVGTAESLGSAPAPSASTRFAQGRKDRPDGEPPSQPSQSELEGNGQTPA